MNRKLEIFLGILIVAIVLIFIGGNIFKGLFDSEVGIDKIQAAMDDNNLDYLKNRIEIEGREGNLKTEELKAIVDLLKDSIYNGNLKGLDGDLDKNIYLKKEGKEKFIFDKYILVLKPYRVIVRSNIPDSIVYIDDNEVGLISKDSSELVCSNISPGVHNIRVVYEGEYSKLEGKDQIICFNRDSDEFYSDINLDGSYVEIHSNIENANLYVNEENTNISLANGYKLGPIAMDKSISISAKAEIEGQVFESDVYYIDGYISYYDLYIDYVEAEELVEVVEVVEDELIYSEQEDDYIVMINNLMSNYQYGMVEAINSNNYNYVGDWIEEGSPLEISQLKLIDHLSSKGTSEKLVDYSIENISKVSDSIFEVKVSENHNIFYSSGKSDLVFNQWIYTVVKHGDSLYLRNLRK